MRMFLLAAVLAVFTVTVSGDPRPAEACPPRLRYYPTYYPTYQPFYNTVIEKIVTVQEVVPIATFIPTYFTGAFPAPYMPPATTASVPAARPSTQAVAPVPAASSDPCEALRARVTALEQQLQECKKLLEQKGPGPATPPKKENVERVDAGQPPVKLFVQKCASCHDKAVAEKYGKGFTLLENGKLAPLGLRQKLAISTMTYAGKMPKAGVKDDKGKEIPIEPLTDEDVGQIQAWLGGK